MSESRAQVLSAEPVPLRAREHDWLRIGSLTAVFLGILGLLYAPIVPVWLEDLWDDPNYTHSFFVPLISGFIMWRRRGALAAAASDGTWRGLPVLLAGIVALIVGDIAAETFLMRTSLIVILAGLVLLQLGPAALRVLVFPLAFLAFMVPVPQVVFYPMTAGLQNVAAESGAAILDLVQVPVVLDAKLIHLSRCTLRVS